MIYIISTRRAVNANHVKEITDYGYLIDNSLTVYTSSKKVFCDKYNISGNVFSQSPQGLKEECELKISENGEKYYQTKANKTTVDNLLNLPNF